jgi:hypothetical protein
VYDVAQMPLRVAIQHSSFATCTNGTSIFFPQYVFLFLHATLYLSLTSFRFAADLSSVLDVLRSTDNAFDDVLDIDGLADLLDFPDPPGISRTQLMKNYIYSCFDKN